MAQLPVHVQAEGGEVGILGEEAVRQALELVVANVDEGGGRQAVEYAGWQAAQQVRVQVQLAEVGLTPEDGGRQLGEQVPVQTQPLQRGQRLQQVFVQVAEAAVAERQLLEAGHVAERVLMEVELLVAGQVQVEEVGRVLEEGLVHVRDIVAVQHWQQQQQQGVIIGTCDLSGGNMRPTVHKMPEGINCQIRIRSMVCVRKFFLKTCSKILKQRVSILIEF